jgi:hypothetical protein
VILKDGEPWFVAVDVCRVLEISNNRDALSRLDEDEKDDVGITDRLNRTQNMAIISESGLYSLVLTSRKPEAKAFKKWLTAEVLPAIRKTGSYSVTPPAPQLPPTRSVLEYTAMAKEFGFADDPHIRLYAKLLAKKEMGLLATGEEARPANQVERSERITTATVRAVELGYVIKSDNGSSLGKWVKARVKPLEQKIQEGQYLVYGYWLNNELDNAIHSYYDALILIS